MQHVVKTQKTGIVEKGDTFTFTKGGDTFTVRIDETIELLNEKIKESGGTNVLEYGAPIDISYYDIKESGGSGFWDMLVHDKVTYDKDKYINNTDVSLVRKSASIGRKKRPPGKGKVRGSGASGSLITRDLLTYEELPFAFDEESGQWFYTNRKGDMKIQFKSKLKGLEWASEGGEQYSGIEGFQKLLQDNPTKAAEILEEMGMESVSDLLVEEMPEKKGSLTQTLGFAANIAGLASDIVRIGKAETVQDKKKGMTSAALNAISLLFPSARGFVGAYTVGRNLSEFFGGKR